MPLVALTRPTAKKIVEDLLFFGRMAVAGIKHDARCNHGNAVTCPCGAVDARNKYERQLADAVVRTRKALKL